MFQFALSVFLQGNENNNATEKLVDEKTKQLEDSGLLSRITLQLKGLLGIEVNTQSSRRFRESFSEYHHLKWAKFQITIARS